MDINQIPIIKLDDEDIPEQLPLLPEHTPIGMIEATRQSQYQKRSDPLFFQWQRGKATQQEWLDEIDAIKAEYPDPE